MNLIGIDYATKQSNISLALASFQYGKATVQDTKVGSETPGKLSRHSPLFGEHNQYLYGELLGLNFEEISALVEEQVIY